MASWNNVTLLGNLTDTPKLRTTEGGTSVANFAVATNRRRANGSEEVTYVDCAAWGQTAETVAKYKQKGDLVFLSGRLQQDRWEKNGVQHSKLQVVVEKIQFLPNGGAKATRRPATFEESDAMPELAETGRVNLPSTVEEFASVTAVHTVPSPVPAATGPQALAGVATEPDDFPF